jgi:hypothetical protein
MSLSADDQARFEEAYLGDGGLFQQVNTRLPLVSTTCEMECNVSEPSYIIPRRGILEVAFLKPTNYVWDDLVIQPISYMPSEN